MSHRNKSLLEAFQVSGPMVPAKDVSADPPPPVAPAPSAGAPRPGLRLRGSQIQLLVLAQLLVLLIAFLLGRASVDGVAAAPLEDGDAPRASFAADPAPAPPVEPQSSKPAVAEQSALDVDPTPRTAAEQALLDPRNTYTIKLVEYANTETNIRLARETLRYLTEDQGLPACVAGTESRLYILVGAAPNQVDFDDLLRRVRKMNGPPPLSRPTEFDDAYLEKIDKVFRRK